MSTGTFNNVNELTALSGGWVVGFTGTTTEDAAVTLGGQAAQTSLVGTRFEKAVTLPAGTNTVTVAAVDPSGNTNSKNYRVVVSSGAAQSFTYDANGNMTSDGTRTYAWDAENRLIKITEGTKTTDIEYDGFHHWTRIVERNGATTVSDRRFIWDGNTLVEQRNGTSTTAAQRCFPQGVQQGTNKFFYTRDHLGSIREVGNNSGAVVARYDYDPYGRRTKLSGTFDSDFGFTGHYFHAPSGLHFAPFRAYSAEFGRWISRDPIEEEGGINLYAYVSNNPVNLVDPLGLSSHWGAGGVADFAGRLALSAAINALNILLVKLASGAGCSSPCGDIQKCLSCCGAVATAASVPFAIINSILAPAGVATWAYRLAKANKACTDRCRAQ